MFLTVHAAVGAALAQSFGLSSSAAFVAGFISHFAIDVIPHGDQSLGEGLKGTTDQVQRIKKRITWIVAADLLLLAGLWRVLAISSPASLAPAMLVGSFGAMLPDALQLPDILWGKWKGYRAIHEYLHNLSGARVLFPVGMIIQGMMLTIALMAIS